MTSSQNRRRILELVDEALDAGASQKRVSEELGLSQRTLRRWREGGSDDRPAAQRAQPKNALSEDERDEIIRVCNQQQHQSKAPAQIVVDLADQGRYLASESTFYRVLNQHQQTAHRGRARAPRPRPHPGTHKASGVGQIWVWDITWLPSAVTGLFYRLYIIMDLYSRKIVASEVWEEENAQRARQLVRRAALAENIAAGGAPVLHGDNGSALKAGTVLALMHKLGITPSHSRPRVSNDNAHAEAFFRTSKYHPSLSPKGFDSLEQARQWAAGFMHWYNHEHKHRSLNYVTPHQKHCGQDLEILTQRHRLYQQKRQEQPDRWIKGRTRNWSPTTMTTLNPVDTRIMEKTLKKSA